ncbi:MAG TPA: sugar transferase [Myxococcota bacterium]|nr:sugar transferase [Myxococcota bacterium]
MNYYARHPSAPVAVAAIALDAVAFLAAAALTWSNSILPCHPAAYWGSVAAGGSACFLSLTLCDAYRPENLRSVEGTLRALLSTMGIAFVAAVVLHFAIPTPPGVVATLATAAALYFPFLAVGRVLFQFLARLPLFRTRVLILGRSDVGLAVAQAITVDKSLPGVELVGFLKDEEDDDWESTDGYPVVGPAHELEKILSAIHIDAIVVASTDREAYFPADQLLHAKLHGVHIESGVSFYERVTGRVFVRRLRPSYLIFNEGFRVSPLAEAVRRGMDVAISSIGLACSLPVLALAAVAIRLDSKGPIFFRQERVGLHGRSFELLKLRTMTVDAESHGPTFTSARDPRITRVGRFLRKTRLDEVPQFWNILVGDMSIVGPRPERPEFMDLLNARSPLFGLRTARKPGLTGWAQVRHGYVNDIEDFESKLGLDLYYVMRRSLFLDLVILFHTVKTVVLFRGL